MKKLFIFELIYYLLLNVIGPIIYYGLRGGSVFIYHDPFPSEYMYKAALLISVPVIITLILVAFVLPIGKSKIKQDLTRNVEWYFIGICAISIVKMLFVGKFANYGAINGTLWGYLGFFMDMGVLLTVILATSAGKTHMLLIGTVYLVTTLMAYSRQGPLILVLAILIALLVNDNYKKLRKRMLIIILCICIAAPIVFAVSSLGRGKGTKDLDTVTEVTDLIVGRCSQLELLGRALYQSENDLWNEAVFQEKYSIENQAKQCVNAVVIGGVFEEDIMPNQYYRMIFMEYPEDVVKSAYTSINLTLPGYLSLKYPVVVAIVVPVIVLLLIYLLACYAKWPSYFSVTLLIFGTNSLMGFFDWVMVLNDFRRFLCTLLMLWLVHKLIDKFIPKDIVRKKINIFGFLKKKA